MATCSGRSLFLVFTSHPCVFGKDEKFQTSGKKILLQTLPLGTYGYQVSQEATLVGDEVVQGLFGVVWGLQFHPGKEWAHLSCLLLLGFGPGSAGPQLLFSTSSKCIKHIAINCFSSSGFLNQCASHILPYRVLLWLPLALYVGFILRGEKQGTNLCHFVQNRSLQLFFTLIFFYLGLRVSYRNVLSIL